jgi:hypothetical protein
VEPVRHLAVEHRGLDHQRKTKAGLKMDSFD